MEEAVERRSPFWLGGTVGSAKQEDDVFRRGGGLPRIGSIEEALAAPRVFALGGAATYWWFTD
jgi:hypothetical protein